MASPAQATGFACVISAATGKVIGGRIISVHKGGDVTVSSRTRIAQTCLGRSGRFWPTNLPLFQARRFGRTAGKFDVCMKYSPISHFPPHRQPNVAYLMYHGLALNHQSPLRAHCVNSIIVLHALAARLTLHRR